VFRYRDAAAYSSDSEAALRKEEGKRSVAVEVRVCVTKAVGEEPPYVSWYSWSLGDDSRGSFEAWSTYSDSATVQPLYPEDKVTPVGTCRRGWLIFEITPAAKPTFVEYNTGSGNVLTWPLKR
jgi:hypothetical protein